MCSPWSMRTWPLTMTLCMPAASCLRRLAPPGRSGASSCFEGSDGVGVEDHDVGGVAGAEEAAVVEAEDEGRVEGELADGLFEEEDALFSDPVAEDVGGEAVVGAEDDVRAAVGLAEEEAGAVEHGGHGDGVAVALSSLEDGFEVFFEGEVKEGVEDVLCPGRGRLVRRSCR